jgi:putative oxidoreductase
LQQQKTAFVLALNGEALVVALGTRFAVAGLLLMTYIIELTVPDGWPIHIAWAAMALGIAAWGPGRISIVHWIASRVRGA